MEARLIGQWMGAAKTPREINAMWPWFKMYITMNRYGMDRWGTR